MAAKKNNGGLTDSQKRAQDPEAPKIEDAADGVDSRLTEGYEDNPDKPNESTVAQVEVLKEEEAE